MNNFKSFLFENKLKVKLLERIEETELTFDDYLYEYIYPLLDMYNRKLHKLTQSAKDSFYLKLIEIKDGVYRLIINLVKEPKHITIFYKDLFVDNFKKDYDKYVILFEQIKKELSEVLRHIEAEKRGVEIISYNPLNSTKLHLEAKLSSAEEYYKSIMDYYNDNNLLDIIKQGEDNLQHIGINNIKTEISDNNNLIIRYAIFQNNIFVLGISAKSGKIKKGDIPDLKNWMQKLYNAIKNGSIIYTSPNKLSLPILKKIIEKLKKDGIKVEIKEIGKVNIGDKEWVNLIIKKTSNQITEKFKIDISDKYGKPEEEDDVNDEDEIDQQEDTEKFKKYREVILKRYNYDIKNFKLKSKTSLAYKEKVKITDFSLKQILNGIKIEGEHTSDIGTRLEIALSHLAEKPKYYTLLIKYIENGPKN